MGRSFYVDEDVDIYISKLIQQQKAFVTGLIVGQFSFQRDYVLLAAQTPQKEDQGDGLKSGLSKLEEIDEEWISMHASQVGRMLPGGLLVLGVFLITSPDLSKDVQNALRKLVFAVEKSSMKNRLWHFEEGDVSERIALHICSATRKVTCRTFDVNDPKSTAKPADWKYQNFASSWLMIDCNVHLDVTIPLTSSSFQDQQKSTRLGLAKWAKEIENAVVLFNGQTKDINEDLFEDLKKSSRSANHSSPQIITTNILTSSPVIEDTRTTALVQSCKSSLTIHGVVKCRGYVHSNRPKVKDAVQAIKRDILNTTKDRCEILFEDIILNGLQREKDVWQLPQRVFVPIHGSSLLLCDYLFGDETANDLQSHFLEILDQDVQQDGLEFTEQKSSKTIAEEKENISQPQHTTGVQTNSSKSSSEIRLNKGFLIAGIVATIATSISLYYII